MLHRVVAAGATQFMWAVIYRRDLAPSAAAACIRSDDRSENILCPEPDEIRIDRSIVPGRALKEIVYWRYL